MPKYDKSGIHMSLTFHVRMPSVNKVLTHPEPVKP